MKTNSSLVLLDFDLSILFSLTGQIKSAALWIFHTLDDLFGRLMESPAQEKCVEPWIRNKHTWHDFLFVLRITVF